MRVNDPLDEFLFILFRDHVTDRQIADVRAQMHAHVHVRRQATQTEEDIQYQDIETALTEAEVSIENMLRPFQEALVAEAVLALLKLTPSEYHTLTLDTADAPDLEQLLADIYKAGRELVANELKRQGAAEVAIGDTSESEVAQLQTIADATISRLVNDVQFRAAALATQKAVKGLEGDALEAALRSALEEASTTYVTRGAREAATVVLGKGRRAEGIARADDIGKVIFSALLDRNCCSPCSEEDGTEYESVAVAPQVPFDACEGGAQC